METKEDDVNDAIQYHYTANIKYNNGKDDGSRGRKRYCQILNVGTIKGKPAIRVFQITGPNIKKDKEGNEIRWKTFMVDKIDEIVLTKFKAPPITSRDHNIPWNPNRDLTLGLGAGSSGLATFGKDSKSPGLKPSVSRPDGPTKPTLSKAFNNWLDDKNIEEPTNDVQPSQDTTEPIVNKFGDADPEPNMFDKVVNKGKEVGQTAVNKIKDLGNWFKKQLGNKATVTNDTEEIEDTEDTEEIENSEDIKDVMDNE